MPDPYLDDIVAAQNAAMMPNYEQTQKEQLEYLRRLKEWDAAERNSLRVDRYADDVGGPGALTGEEARARQLEHQATHAAERHRYTHAEREAEAQLTDAQRKVARQLGLSMTQALAASRDDPSLPTAILSNYNFCVEIEERHAARQKAKAQKVSRKSRSRKVA
jgi:hypothetical protein